MKACRVESLLSFLGAHRVDTIYMVGDILDMCALRKGYWPPAYNELVMMLYKRIKEGVRVIYLPGNHDDFLRKCQGSFDWFEIVDTIIHTTPDGRRFLVLHGDQHDFVSTNMHWASISGNYLYDFAIFLNRWIARARKKLNLPYWSFAQWAKTRVKRAVTFVEGFETILAQEAKRHNCDGVICGHTHTPVLKVIDGICYANCGDWIESCSALVEDHYGRFHLINWPHDVRP